MIVQAKRASAGTYTGVVRYIKYHTDLGLLEPGEILATKMTTPDWIGAFDQIKRTGGAIVTATGGMTCHAAVVCREYKIPCVVGWAEVQQFNGRTITVDGAKGTVEVHD